jgi:hypothetical protein
MSISRNEPPSTVGATTTAFLPAKEARDAASLGKYLPLIKKAG